jgi:hypothetical protein
MLFTLRKDWEVSFLEADLTISPLKTQTFADPEAIRELARRGRALGTSQAQALFDYSIGNGSGGFYLELTTEEYSSGMSQRQRYSGCCGSNRNISTGLA